MTKRRYLFLLVAVLAMAAVAVTALQTPVASAVGAEVKSHYVSGDLPVQDPGSTMWGQSTALDVPLSGQTLIAPTAPEPTVTQMTVRSLNNGEWIAFLLEWDDPTMDQGGRATDFKDAAAIQFPSVSGEPFYCMGMSDGVVEILQWRADLQHDIEVGGPLISEIYPDSHVNVYPGGDDETFLTGRAVGNLVSQGDLLSPVQDLIAGGFGTLTSQLSHDADGWAQWDDGKWTAVIARPMLTTDDDDAQFTGGTETSLALAAWDGGKQEVNGRKSVSTWVTFEVEPAPVAAGSGGTSSGSEAETDAGPPPAPEIITVTETEFPTGIVIGLSLVAVLGILGALILPQIIRRSSF